VSGTQQVKWPCGWCRWGAAWWTGWGRPGVCGGGAAWRSGGVCLGQGKGACLVHSLHLHQECGEYFRVRGVGMCDGV